MSESRGKLFEREFRKGLLLLDGICIRLHDGCAGPKTMKQPADFVYADKAGIVTFLIECKSTSQNSFPFANLKKHQLESLLSWQQDSWGTRVGLVALEYWKHRRTFLLRASDVQAEINSGERKSLPLCKAEEVGIEIFRKNGDGGFAYDLSCLERWWEID